MANEPATKVGGGFFNMKNPLKSAPEKKGNEPLPESSTLNLPNGKKDGRGPFMPDPRNPGKSGPTAAGQQNLPPFNGPGQQDDPRGPLRGKKGAAQLPKGLQPQDQREPTPAEASYLSTLPSKATREALGLDKPGAEKEDKMAKAKGLLPSKQPQKLGPQKNSFESERLAGPPAVALGNVPPNKQAKQLPGQGRPEPPTDRNAPAGLPPNAAPQLERDGRGRRPGPPGPEAKPNPPLQAPLGALPGDKSAKGQGLPPQLRDGPGLRAGERPAPAQDIKGGMLPLDNKGRPVPPMAGGGLPGRQPPMFDERGRPIQPPQGPPPRFDERGRPIQPPQGPPPQFDARGKPIPPQQLAQSEVPGVLAPGAKNPRGPPNMNKEPEQPMFPPGREDRGRQRGRAPDAVPNVLPPRDDRGRVAPQKPEAQGRDIPNALLPGGRPSLESAKAPKDRRPPSPPRDGPRRPGSPPRGRRPSPGRNADGSRRPPSPPSSRGRRSGSRGRALSPSKGRQDEMFAGNMPPKKLDKNGRPVPEASDLTARNVQEQGRDARDPGAAAPREPLPPLPALRNPASKGSNGAEDRPSKDGRRGPPGPEPPKMGGDKESDRRMPPAGAAAGQPPPPPSFLRDPSAKQGPPASQGVPPLPPQDQSSRRPMPPMPPMPPNQDRSLGPQPPLMPNDRDRKMPPVPGEPPAPPAAIRNGPAGRDRSRSRPPPKLSERKSLYGEKPGPDNGQMPPPPPHETGLPGFGAPLRDDPRAPRPDERNMPGQPKGPINPREQKPAAKEIPGPFNNSFNEPRDLRGPQGPKDRGQPPVLRGINADGRGGQGPPFPPSRDWQMNDMAKSSTPSARDVGKLDTTMPARNMPSAEPSSATSAASATASPSKGGWSMKRVKGFFGGKKETPVKETPVEAKRPSLLPQGIPERMSRELARQASAAGVAQPDQSGRAPFSQPKDVRPDQTSGDLKRGPNDLPPFQSGGDGPRKTLVDARIPHSRDGQKQAPPEPPFPRESRGRVQPFTMPQKPMPPAPNNVNESDLAPAAARDMPRDKQDEPKMTEKEQRKMNRKSNMIAGMMPPVLGQGDDMPVPAIPQAPSAYKNGDERPITPGGTQVPPAPVLNGKQRRAANRKSHMNGFGPADLQMPPVPSLPEQPPAHKDDASVSSDLPPSLRPGVPDGMPQGQRDLADEPTMDKPGMVPPPPMGLKRGLPSGPRPRGAKKEPAQFSESGAPLPPVGTEMERSDLSQDSQLPSALRPGRPDLKLDSKHGEQLPPPADGLSEPMPNSRDMRANVMGMPDNPKSKKAKRVKDKEQTRPPLSPLDGNRSPRSPLRAESENMPPSSQKPSSPKSNKLKDLLGKTKGKESVSREIGSPTMGSEKALSPTSKTLADYEKELENIQRPRFSDSSLTTDMPNTPPSPNKEFKDMGRKDVNGRKLRDAPPSLTDNKNNRLDPAPFLSLGKDDKAGKKNKSRGLPGDKQDESVKNGDTKDTKRDFLGGLFGGKDQMSPMGSPTFNDEPLVAGNVETSEDKKPGFFDLGRDKKDRQRRGSRGFMPESLDDAPRSPAQGEPWPSNVDAFDDKSSGDKKTHGLFGRNKDKKSKAGSESPTGKKNGLFGKDKRKDGDAELHPGSPRHSPIMGDGSPVQPWAEDETSANGQKPDEKKTGFFGSLGKDKKNKKNTSGSPLGSPTRRDSWAASPGLERTSMDEDGVPGSKDKGTGLFSGFGKDKEQRRGSKSGDRDSILLDSADGNLDENTPGDKKSGFKGLFSKDKDGKNKQQAGDNDEIMIPALLVVPGQPQQGSPVESDENFSSLSEADKKKKGKGLFGFGKNKKNGDERYDDNYDEKSDWPASPQLDLSAPSEFGQKDKYGKDRDSFSSRTDDIYTDQYGQPLSPQLDMGKKDKKGKGLFGRFGKSKDGDLTPTTLDGFNDHEVASLSPRDDFPMSPEVGKKDKDGKGFFGWGKNKNRDSPRASPLGDSFDKGGMSPRSPEFDSRQSGEVDSFPAMASPRESFNGGNYSPTPAYQEPMSPVGEPDSMKPAPLKFKDKLRNAFDTIANVGKEHDDGRPQSGDNFGGASGKFYYYYLEKARQFSRFLRVANMG